MTYILFLHIPACIWQRAENNHGKVISALQGQQRKAIALMFTVTLMDIRVREDTHKQRRPQWASISSCNEKHLFTGKKYTLSWCGCLSKRQKQWCCITYLCSCGALRGQRELSHRWRAWGEGAESCVTVVASPSLSVLLAGSSLRRYKLLDLSELSAAQGSYSRSETEKYEVSLSVTSLIE